jgi:RNA polymerase sigma factor (sigma-70 family)
MDKNKKIEHIDPYGDDGFNRTYRLNDYELRVLAATALTDQTPDPEIEIPDTNAVLVDTTESPRPLMDSAPMKNDLFDPKEVDELVFGINSTKDDTNKKNRLYADLIHQCYNYYQSILERSPAIQALVRKSRGTVEIEDLVQNHMLDIDKNIAEYLEYVKKNDKKPTSFLSFSSNFLVSNSIKYMDKNGVSPFTVPGIAPEKKIYFHEQALAAKRREFEEDQAATSKEPGESEAYIEPEQPTDYDNSIVAARRLISAGQVKELDTTIDRLFTETGEIAGYDRSGKPRGIIYAAALTPEASLTQHTPDRHEITAEWDSQEYDTSPDTVKNWLENSALCERDKEIVRLRYGLPPHKEPLKFEEIGQHLGISKGQVYPILIRAQKKLRANSKDLEIVANNPEKNENMPVRVAAQQERNNAGSLAQQIVAEQQEIITKQLKSELNALNTVVGIASRSNRQSLSLEEQLVQPTALSTLVIKLYHRAKYGSLKSSFAEYLHTKNLEPKIVQLSSHFVDTANHEKYAHEIKMATGQLSSMLNSVGPNNAARLKEFIDELGHVTTTDHYKHHIDDIIGWLTDLDTQLPKSS